ncbi:MAG: class I SAM-dependent methyltransferase [Candidatus Hydrogenedentes bacterium]|nr:class I SAM-dependent methyltransferase [Candidatus Hydrogenedentota bacterium]
MSGACICCEGADAVPHLRGLLRCPDCTHVWADMRLSDEELRALYAENYFLGEEYLDYEKEAPALRRNFRLRLRELTARAPGGALWEIGSAYGNFLQEAREYYAVAGCDISDHAAARARDVFGQQVTCGDYLTLDIPMGQDVVCLWDTIEHLAAPAPYLARAAEQLRPGGVLALSTGDIGAWLARVRGEKWRLIHPPTHLHYFTARSMRTLLARLGFVEVEVRHHAFWRSADAVAYRLIGHPPDRWTAGLYRLLNRAGALDFSFPVNTFDLMTVYARKGAAE